MNHAPERRRISWHFWLPQVIAGVIYAVIGIYQIGVYSSRMQSLEKAVEHMGVQVEYLSTHVEWRK